jgi:hypothetical protein
MQGLDQCLLRALTGSMLTYCFIPTHCHLIVFRTLVQFPLPVLSCAGPLLTQTKTGPHEDSKKEVPHLWDGPKAVTSKKSWMILLLVKIRLLFVLLYSLLFFLMFFFLFLFFCSFCYDFVILLLSFWNSLCIRCINPLSDAQFVNTFTHFVGMSSL